jgi:hypothetical protein
MPPPPAQMVQGVRLTFETRGRCGLSPRLKLAPRPHPRCTCSKCYIYTVAEAAALYLTALPPSPASQLPARLPGCCFACCCSAPPCTADVLIEGKVCGEGCGGGFIRAVADASEGSFVLPPPPSLNDARIRLKRCAAVEEDGSCRLCDCMSTGHSAKEKKGFQLTRPKKDV